MTHHDRIPQTHQGMRYWRAENTANLARLGLAYDRIHQIQQVARALHNLDEAACNGELTQRQTSRERNLTRRAYKILSGYHVDRNHDPRGWPLEISQSALDDASTRTSYSALDFRVSVCPF